MTLLLTISFLLILATLAVNVIIHYNIWVLKKEVNHKKAALLRGIGFVLAAIPLFIAFWPEDFWPGILWTLLNTLSGIFFYCSFYWLAFDGIYNKVRKYPFWQIGTIEKDEAKTDNILRKLSPLEHKIIKIGLVLTSLTLYIVIIKIQYK